MTSDFDTLFDQLEILPFKQVKLLEELAESGLEAAR